MNRAITAVRDRGKHDVQAEVSADASSPDGEAFALMYERHLPGIYSYALAHTRSEEDAADLSQQVFTQALAALPRYRQQEVPVRIWLFRIARNLMIDFYRRRHPAVAWEILPDSTHPVAADDVEAAVVRRESSGQLLAILAQLEPQVKDLLVLRFAAGLKVREIASLLDRSEAAISSQLRRTLLALRECVPRD
jgi:RNA polymerase sigma-70 factor (ECF subfamily)